MNRIAVFVVSKMRVLGIGATTIYLPVDRRKPIPLMVQEKFFSVAVSKSSDNCLAEKLSEAGIIVVSKQDEVSVQDRNLGCCCQSYFRKATLL